MSGPQRVVCPDPEVLARESARRIASSLMRTIEREGVASLALAGGRTFHALYRALASPACRDQVLWALVEIFWTDERCVPKDHADSNYGAARREMLDSLPIDPERIHRIEADDPDAGAAASRYEEALRAILPPRPNAETPRLDLLLLGVGEDGHTASLFAGSEAASEKTRLVLPSSDARWGKRITMTAPMFLAAREAFVLVAGSDKAEIVERVLLGPHDPAALPAQLLAEARGRVTWMLDAAAAARIEPEAGATPPLYPGSLPG